MERYPVSWTGRIVIVKMSILPKAIYRFNEISIKISMTFFYRTRTNNPKIYMEPRKTLNSQNNLEKKEQSWSIMLPDFRLYNPKQSTDSVQYLSNYQWHFSQN